MSPSHIQALLYLFPERIKRAVKVYRQVVNGWPAAIDVKNWDEVTEAAMQAAILAAFDDPERIERAASMHHGVVYDVPRPGRHGTIIRMLSAMGLCGPGNPVTCEGGFLTSHGRFVDREEAWKIAVAAEQLLERAPTDHKGGTLYSEDVW